MNNYWNVFTDITLSNVIFCLILSIFCFSFLSFDILIVDFLNVNIHRDRYNAVLYPLVSSLIFCLICIPAVLFVFSLSSFILAAIIIKYVLLLMIIVTPIVSFYIYDLIPEFQLGINAGADWSPYQHGITIGRLIGMTIFQSTIAGFAALRWVWRGDNDRRKRVWLFRIACLAAILLGAIIRLGGHAPFKWW